MPAPTPTRFSFNPLTGNFDKIMQDPAKVVTVANSGAMYTTIQAALDSITDATSVKQYKVIVEPGNYAPFIAKPFCHIEASPGTVNVVGADTSAITGSLTGTDSCNISGINFVNYSATDNGNAGNVSGDVNFLLCNFYLIKTNDTSGVALKTSSESLQIIGQCSVFTSRLGSALMTKGLDGIRCNGAGRLSVYLSSISVDVNASSGDTCCVDENGAGERNYNGLLIYYRNTNASFAGTAKGFCVSSKSSGQRLSQGCQIRLEGAGAGTGYAFALDSSTNDATYYHSNAVVAVDGFATNGVAFTGLGDVQRVWLSSPTRDIPKYGTGLSVITPLDKKETGFVEWGQEATYWTYNTGTGLFTVDKSGAGCVHGAPMSWAAGQSVTITDRAVSFVYMNSAGTIGVSTSGSGIYEDNVVLFEVWRQGTNYIVCKENHPFKFTTAVSEAWHGLFGTLLQDATQTLAINSAANRTVNLVGSNTLTDHGLDSTVTAQTPMTLAQMVEGVSGAMAQIGNQTGIISKKSDGTDAGVNVANGRFVVYRIGVMKESLNSATPTFLSIADNADSANLSAANTRITSGLVRSFPVEARRLEIAQLGFAIVQADGAGGGTLSQVTTALQVFGAQFVSGGTSSAASLITTDTTNFAGELGATETNVQLALDRIDDYDSLLDWGTGKAYRVGNTVRVTTEGFIGTWRCVTAHTASAAITTDINLGYWEIVANSEGSRELVNQASHGFVAGDAVYYTGSAYAKAKADAAATAEFIGFVAGATTNYFVLAKTGKLKKTGWGLTAGSVYFLSDATAGAITATDPTTVSNISKPVGIAVSTTEVQIVNMRGTTVGGTNVYTTIALANNAATTIQNVSGSEFPAGTGGFIEGFIKIDATTDTVVTFKAEWSKPITGTAYKCSVTYGADDLPAGVSIDITTGGLIQVTLPSVTGFSSASATFAMQAAAIGATLPLQISGAQVTGPVLGSTSGAAAGAGYVGEIIGTERAGTGGKTYSDQSSTAITPAATEVTLISRTLNKGIYRLDYTGSVNVGTSDTWFTSVFVGGTRVNRVNNQMGEYVVAGQICTKSFSMPIVITADSTAVVISGRLPNQTSSSSEHEAYWTRIG